MMSDDDPDTWDAKWHDSCTPHLEQTQRPDGYQDSAASLCRDSMENEVVDSIQETRSRLSMETRPASEDDSAMESFAEKDKDDVIVVDEKIGGNCEMKGTKLDSSYFRKLEPTWDFMEGCSYDVQNYRTNGELSYIKDIQPSRQSSEEFAYLRHDASDIDISCSFGDEYFLPLSQDLAMLNIGSTQDDLEKCLLLQDSLESHGYDSIYAARQERSFGTIESCGKSALLDHVRKSLGGERWDDPSLESSLYDESSVDESSGDYLVLSEDDSEQDDLEKGGIAKAFRFVFGMGAFAALHLMK